MGSEMCIRDRLELVRGGRVTLGPEGELKMRRGRIDRTKEEQ